MSATLVALRKDALLQWRTRGKFVAVFVFGAATLLLFSFAIGPDAGALRAHAGGFLWLALLLASTLALGDSFHGEMEHRAMEGLVLVPASPVGLYYGKAIANWAQLALLGVALIPFMVVLYDAPARRAPALLGLILLGTAGLSAPGTLYAAMTVQVRSNQTLLPLLLFPLVVPVLVASVNATTLVLTGDPMDQLRDWTLLLLCFDLIYGALCGLLFGRVVES